VVAGLVLWVGMMPILMFRLALAFFEWSQAESRRAGRSSARRNRALR